MQENDNLLAVSHLKTCYFTARGIVKAADDVSFKVRTGETVGLVGESGCGKSTVAYSIVRLLPPEARVLTGSKIIFKGEDLATKSDEEMRNIRGKEIAVIFQDPTTSLNPVLTAGYQVAEAPLAHKMLNRSDAYRRAIEMLDTVSIPEPNRRARQYPDEFSVGMQQRVMAAMALCCKPSLFIADEPTSALDVTIGAQILELMTELKQKTGSSIVLITHNMGIVAETTDRVCVMYAGEIVESADVETLFENPRHPYTRGLINSIPRPDVQVHRLDVIPGEVPNLLSPPTGCKFHPRCRYVMDVCREVRPQMRLVESGVEVACHLYGSSSEV